MIKRLLRVIVGILLVITLPVNIIIFLLYWVITGKPLFIAVLNWTILGEFNYD